MGKTTQETIVVSTGDAASPDAVEVLGIVMGVIVRSNSQAGNFLSKLKALGGGKLVGYQKIVRESREEAIAEMVEKAAALGATRVIDFRFDSSEIKPGEDGSFVEVTAYGTAIRPRAVATKTAS